ncbi:MAG: ribonuclease P protein component [Rhodospirillales bacterium]|nr:ribonuclease P protein component [Rhodospirillales bacterium]
MKAPRAQAGTLVSLKKRSDFLRARDKGRRWVSQGLVIQAVPRAENSANAETSPEAGRIRFGLTVTKKVDRRAVVRNRIKRRLRAAAAQSLVLANPDFDYVLIGRTETLDRPYARLCGDITWCLSKMGLLAENPS